MLESGRGFLLEHSIMPSTRRITGLCNDALFESLPPKEVEKALRPFLVGHAAETRVFGQPAPLPVPELPADARERR